jgi:hypothetical protein
MPRANFLFSRQEGPNLYMSKASATDVTGSHALKIASTISPAPTEREPDGHSATSYRFNNAIPNLINGAPHRMRGTAI